MRQPRRIDEDDANIDRERIDRRPDAHEGADPIDLGWQPDPDRYETAPEDLYEPEELDEIDRDYVEGRWGTRELPPAWGWGPFERSTRGHPGHYGTHGRGASYGYDGEAVVMRPGPDEDAEMPLAGAHPDRGPKGWSRSDERIYEDVCEAMTEHPRLDCSDIEVAVEDGEVILTGTVSDPYLKYLAEDITYDVRGVREVLNEIRVRRRP